MARKPEIAELSTKLLMTELGSEKRYKRILVFGGIGVVVLGGAIFAIARTVDARETSAREAALGALSTCLIGAEPLKDGEPPSGRLANIKLGVVGVPLEKRTKGNELSWPTSCSAHAYELKEHAGDTPLGTAAEALGKALKSDANATADLHVEIDKLWAEAAAAKVKGVPPEGAVAAPKPAVPLFTGEQFRALPRFLSGGVSLANVREESSPGAKLYFLVDQKDTPEGPVLCAVNATEPTLKCLKAPEAVATLSPGLRLVGTTDDAARPFFFAGDRGQLGIFPPDGRHAIAAAVAYGASARADGSIIFTTRKDGSKELRLVFQPAVGATSEQSLLQGTEYEQPGQTGLFWDWVVSRTPGPTGKTGAPSHLFARKVELSVVKPAVDVGELDEPAAMDKADRDPSLVSACKSDDALVVRVRGQRTDSISFYAGGRWSSPVKSVTHGGALTCHGLEAVNLTVEHSPDRDKDYPTITVSKCNTSGCTPTKVEMRQTLVGIGEIAPSDAGNSVAADVGGKLMLMWNGGLAGGLRMRLGAADRFKEAEDVVITDGRDEKSNVSSIAQMKVMSTNTFAVVVLSTTSGVKVLRVDATGKVTPLQASL